MKKNQNHIQLRKMERRLENSSKTKTILADILKLFDGRDYGDEAATSDMNHLQMVQ